MSSANINLFVIGIDWSEDGGGLTFLGLRVGGSRSRGLELGLNPGLGVEVNDQGIGAGARADLGIKDGVSAGVAAHAGFAVFHAEAGGMVGWDSTEGTWGKAHADAFDCREDPEARRDRMEELQRRVAAAWQSQGLTPGSARTSWRYQTHSPAAAAARVLCPDCGQPPASARFCGATGRPHCSPCAACGLSKESSPFCTVTGQQHA